jgi:hypothetical protein
MWHSDPSLCTSLFLPQSTAGVYASSFPFPKIARPNLFLIMFS